jgi:hypothetical protein
MNDEPRRNHLSTELRQDPLPCFDRSEIALAEQQVGVAARGGDERLLSADRLPQELVAARWLRFTTG